MNFLKKIPVEVTAAIVGALFAYVIYLIQFHDSKKTELYEHKLSSMERYIKNTTARIYYMRYMDWIHLEVAKEQTKALPNPNTLKPFVDIKYYGAQIFENKYISDSKTQNILKQLQSDSIRYKGYVHANESYSEYNSSYIMAGSFFEPNVNKQLKILDSLLGSEFYQNDALKKIREYKGIYNVINGEIDTIVLKKRYLQLNKVITVMKTEVDKEK